MKRDTTQQHRSAAKTVTAMLVTLALLAGCGSASPAAQASATTDTQVSANATTDDIAASTSSTSDAAASTAVSTAASDEISADASTSAAAEATEAADTTENPDAQPAPDFTLTDQFGNTQSLAQYRGKAVFLNFWATWCPPCRAEMPDIQKLYEEYSAQGEDAEVVILGVAGPGSVDDQDLDGVTAFLSENGYTYPVAMDMTGELFNTYYITAYPTTYMIDKEGRVFGYVQGSLSEDIMRDIIAQTLSGQMRKN